MALFGNQPALRLSPRATDLEDGRLDALADLVPYVDVPGHLGQDIGPERRLLRSGPAEGWRVPGCALQLSRHTAARGRSRASCVSPAGPRRETGGARRCARLGLGLGSGRRALGGVTSCALALDVKDR